MQIKSISNNPYYTNNKIKDQVNNHGESSKNKIQDKLELSKEAKSLTEKGSVEDTEKLDKIKSKIDNNFYNSDSVINKVADSILKEIKK